MGNKKTLCFITVLLCLFASCSGAFACTGFAVYTDRALYGMNFDYPEVGINYSISKHQDTKVFHMSMNSNGSMASIAGMNDKGLFVSTQMLYPEQTLASALKDNEVDLYDFAAEILNRFGRTEDAEKYLEGRTAVNRYVSLHDLVADKGGDAMVVEPGENKTLITKIQNNFIIMTNFLNAGMKGQGPGADESGSGRYTRAYDYIAGNMDKYTSGDEEGFDIENGFEVLEKTVQDGGSYPTQSSMIFDPERNEIYVAVKHDFSRIWKVSLKEGTIEGYKGFKDPARMKLDDRGIGADELAGFTPAGSAGVESQTGAESRTGVEGQAGVERQIPLIAGIILAVILGLLLLWRIKRSERNNSKSA